MIAALLVAFGGALGTVARWGSTELLGMVGVPAWLATLAINVVGSAVMGWAWIKIQALPASRQSRVSALALTGVLGGFTTFSSFSLQTVELASSGAWELVLAQVVGSFGLAMLGVWAGVSLARRGA